MPEMPPPTSGVNSISPGLISDASIGETKSKVVSRFGEELKLDVSQTLLNETLAYLNEINQTDEDRG